MSQSSDRPFVLRLGTRGSPLALTQARMVQAAVAQANGFDPERIEIVVIRTTGDRIQDRPLSEAGGKGLFTKEIEEALLDGRIDLAVHSSKDMPTALPDGLTLSTFLPREDVRDALISPKAGSLDALPKGAVIGTVSLRRQAMLKRLRPDLEIAILRGNVETRLRKIAEGEADATLLALAGLKRLGLADKATQVLDTDAFLPAVGQGAVGIETRASDRATLALLAPVNHADTATALACERAFLAVLDGSCRTPIGGHAGVSGDRVTFRGIVLRPDGSDALETSRSGTVAEAAALGADAGRELRERAGPGYFAV